MSNGFGLIIDFLVAILLMLTIGYCMLLNRRLKLLQGRRAFAAGDDLRAGDRDRNRRARHRRAEAHRARMRCRSRRSGCAAPSASPSSLDRSLAAGKDVLDRLSQIVIAGAGRRKSRARRIRRCHSRSRSPRKPSPRDCASRCTVSRHDPNYVRDLRLIPIAVIACACLLALKAADLLLDSGSFFAGDDAPQDRKHGGHPHHAGRAASRRREAVVGVSRCSTSPTAAARPRRRSWHRGRPTDQMPTSPARSRPRPPTRTNRPKLTSPSRNRQSRRNQAAGHRHSDRAGRCPPAPNAPSSNGCNSAVRSSIRARASSISVKA